MPKKKRQKRVHRRRRSIGFAGLGAADASDTEREKNFAKRAADRAAVFRRAVTGAEPDCSAAFASLLDVVSYSGMAEAAALAAGGDDKRHAAHAVDAIRAFRVACPFPGIELRGPKR